MNMSLDEANPIPVDPAVLTTRYRDSPAIAQSDVKLYKRSKLLYYQMRVAKTRKPDQPTKSMKFGSNLERFIREGFHNVYTYPEGIKVARGKKYEEWRASLPTGAVVMTPSEYAEITCYQEAIDNVRAHKHAGLLVFGKETEWHKRIFWQDSEGRPRKAELDMYLPTRGGCIADLKTTVSVNPDEFAKQCFNLGYHIQAACYQEAVQSLPGMAKSAPTYFLVAVLNKPPYNVEVYQVPQEWIDQGKEWLNKWLERLQNSYATNDWSVPLTGQYPMLLEAPRWAKYEDEQLEEMIG